jgi:nicotinamide phosphoribosyltransferase
MNNVLLMTDSYKLSHYSQYPEGTEYIYSYIEARKGSYPVVVLGIHDFIDKITGGLTDENVSELQEIAREHGVPFNASGWHSLLCKYGDGISGFPVKVYGVPEGTVVNPSTPVATIVNTDPEFPWLTSFFETLFLRCVWYPSTIASRSRYVKGRIKEFMLRTGADMSTLEFKLHDFGARGVSSGESSAVGGAGHLTQFLGTDNLEAVKYIKDRHEGIIAGFSIPATEHSTVTSWGKEHEKAMYENFLRVNGGEGKIFACVSDSYNIWEALTMWKELEPLLLEVGGTLVVRPDSGDPVLTPVKVIEDLMQLFGFTTNAKGFKVLPDHIRVIQGDGVDEESIVRIMQRMVDRKLSIDNIAFGMGGGLLQKVDRDTLGWAMKCSAARVDGVWRDVWKDPIGGGKTSKRGLVISDGVIDYDMADAMLTTLERCALSSNIDNPTWVVYYNGDANTRPRDLWATVKKRASI